MGFDARRASGGIYETIRVLAEPRAVTALARYPVGIVVAPFAQGGADLLALLTRGMCSDSGGWETTRANYWDNVLTGGEL